MEKTAVSLYLDGKSSELTKFMKGIKTDEVIKNNSLCASARSCIFTCKTIYWVLGM